MRRILITGGSGQVGCALRRSVPAQLRVLAPSSNELDIRNPASVRAAFAKWRPDVLVNAAAYTQVDRAEDEPDQAFAVNAGGPRHLAWACAAVGCPMLHISTDYVFDGKKAAPYAETDVPAPVNVYGRSKLQGEREVAQALDAHLILRTSWVFSATGANFVKTMLRLADREAIDVVADQCGAPTAAASIAKAIWRILDHLAAVPAPHYGLYHLASRPATTWHGFAAAIFALLAERDGGAPTPCLRSISTDDYLAQANRRPVPRPRNALLDGTRLQSVFGVEPADWRPELAGVLRQLA